MAHSRRFYRAAYACFAIAGVGLVTLGCVASQTAPPETSFSAPVTITLPTTQIADALDATGKADRASTETIRVVDSINASNVTVTQPEAARWARATHDAIQEIYAPLHSAKSINDVAADRVIEATNQTNDARQRLKESEMTRAVERAAAKRAIEGLEKQIAQLRAIRGQWLGYSISGLGVLCLALGAIGLIGQKFTKLSFGAGAVGAGLIGIGLAVVNYAVWVSLIGVALFVAFIVGGTIYFVRRAKHEDAQKVALFEAGKAIAKSVETAVDVVDDFNLTDKARKVMKGVQSATPLAETIVDEAQIEMGKKPERAKSAQ